jgi:hypothetical protein
MSASVVFIGGISGVFIGMTIIYFSIKVTYILVNLLSSRKKVNLK